MSGKRFTLYSFPHSFHSQKVLLALHLKEVDFDVVNVDIVSGAQHKPEFMRINPTGKVPVLKDENRIVTESEEIIQHIDKEIADGPILVPSLKTKDGQEVNKWRNILGRIPVDKLMYGVLLHPELSFSEINLPFNLNIQDMKNLASQTLSKLETLAEENPDLKEAYSRKKDAIIEEMAGKSDVSSTSVKEVLDQLEGILDFAEQQVKRSIERERTKDVYMFGTEMNIIDITMAALFELLGCLGLIRRFLGHDKRRFLHRYYLHLARHPAVCKAGMLRIPQSVRIEILK